MPSCRDITELATSYAEGGLEPGERQRFEEHLATCAACRTWVRQLDLAALAVRSLPPPEVPAELRERLMGAFDAWQAARTVAGVTPRTTAAGPGATRPGWEALFALAGVVALLIGVARNPSRAAEDWVISSALAAGAIAFALLARRLTLRFAVVAVSAAFVAAVVRGGPGPLAADHGMECLLIEIGAAAVVAGAAWLAYRRAPGLAALGSWAVAGALAGDAALQISCSQHTSLAHLVTFHAGGVLALAALVLVGGRLRSQAA